MKVFFIVRHRTQDRAVVAVVDGAPDPARHDVYRVAVVGTVDDAIPFDTREQADAAIRLLHPDEAPGEWVSLEVHVPEAGEQQSFEEAVRTSGMSEQQVDRLLAGPPVEE